MRFLSELNYDLRLIFKNLSLFLEYSLHFFFHIAIRVSDSLEEVRDCRSESYKITNIVLDLSSIPSNAKDSDFWPVWVYNGSNGSETILANLSRKVSQVQIDVEFSIHDNAMFAVKSAKSGHVYVNGYALEHK